MSGTATTPAPTALRTASHAPHAHFPAADAIETNLRRQAGWGIALFWIPIVVISVATAIWVDVRAGVGVLLLQLLVLAWTALSTWFQTRRFLRHLTLSPITARTQPALHALCMDVATRIGVPLPPCYIVQDRSLNAFATMTGPRTHVFAIHTGFLDAATPEEVRGVLAHELGHIANRDALVKIMTTGSGRFLNVGKDAGSSANRYSSNNTDTILAIPRLLFGRILPALFALMLQKVSRSREFGSKVRFAE